MLNFTFIIQFVIVLLVGTASTKARGEEILKTGSGEEPGVIDTGFDSNLVNNIDRYIEPIVADDYLNTFASEPSIELLNLYNSYNSTFDLFMKGHETGNGGGVMVCGEGDNLNVRLLDFWEEEKLNNRELVNAAMPFDLVAAEAFRRMSFFKDRFPMLVHILLIQLQLSDVFLRPEIGIEPPSDAQTIFFEKGCNLKGAAAFNDRLFHLNLDKALFSSMSTIDRLGLLFHEAIYIILRNDFGVTDSRLARELTACAFSKEPCRELNTPAVLETMLDGKYAAECEFITASNDYPTSRLTNSRFYLINNIWEDWILVFSHLNGVRLPYLIKTDLPRSVSETFDFANTGEAQYLQYRGKAGNYLAQEGGPFGPSKVFTYPFKIESSNGFKTTTELTTGDRELVGDSAMLINGSPVRCQSLEAPIK